MCRRCFLQNFVVSQINWPLLRLLYVCSSTPLDLSCGQPLTLASQMRVAWSITVELSSAKECPLARQKLSQPPNLLSFEAKAIKIAASNIETSKQVEHRVQPCLVLFKELRVIKQVTYLIRRVRASSCVCHPCARIHS